VIIPSLLILIIAPWFIRRWRWKRQSSGFGVILFLAYLLLISPIGSAIGTRGLALGVPVDPGATADAIVILGRGKEFRPERVQVAADLWQAKRAPLVFVSGRGDAEEIADLLKLQGVPQDAIDGEPCSRTTEENAQLTAAILQPKQIHRILLVTDLPHMLRSLLTFRSLGFDVIPHANPLPPTLDGKKTGSLVFREYVGLISYGLWGRFLPREPSASYVARVAGMEKS
jgi:uncharacterized SAM-binding protein YcdF (DUF218 family)